MTEENREKQEEKPPFLGSWANMYGLVMGVLGLLILLFYLFTRYYS